jgi:hypothetical protein
MQMMLSTLAIFLSEEQVRESHLNVSVYDATCRYLQGVKTRPTDLDLLKGETPFTLVSIDTQTVLQSPTLQQDYDKVAWKYFSLAARDEMRLKLEGATADTKMLGWIVPEPSQMVTVLVNQCLAMPPSTHTLLIQSFVDRLRTKAELLIKTLQTQASSATLTKPVSQSASSSRPSSIPSEPSSPSLGHHSSPRMSRSRQLRAYLTQIIQPPRVDQGELTHLLMLLLSPDTPLFSESKYPLLMKVGRGDEEVYKWKDGPPPRYTQSDPRVSTKVPQAVMLRETSSSPQYCKLKKLLVYAYGSKPGMELSRSSISRPGSPRRPPVTPTQQLDRNSVPISLAKHGDDWRRYQLTQPDFLVIMSLAESAYPGCSSLVLKHFLL